MKKRNKVILGTVVTVLVAYLGLVAYGWMISADYTQERALVALEDGKDITGKTIDIKVNKVLDDSWMGSLFYTSNNLVFQTDETDTGIKVGQEGRVKVLETHKVFGAWIITYEIVEGK